MGRADVSIEDDEDDTGKSSWMAGGAAFLRCGWWIGKRVAIAGVAITSAPVVIPPLLVLSTLGLGFSFPFGIYLAGYACAEKIMSTLLPLPPSKEEQDHDEMESGDLVESGFVADQGDEVVLGGGGLFESGSMNEEARPCVKGETEELKPGEKVGEEEEMVKDVEHMKDAAATAEELRKSDFTKSVQKVKVVIQQGEEVREGATAGSESNGRPKSPYTVVVMGPNGESNRENEPPNLSLEHLSIVELRGKGKTNDTFEDVQPKGVMNELREDGGEEENRLSIANSVVVNDNGLPKECRTEVEPPSLMSEYSLSTVIVPSRDVYAENLEKVGSMDHKSLTKPAPAAVCVYAENLEKVGSMEHKSLTKPVPAAVGVTAVHSHHESIHIDVEKLWVQTFSMRTIVGYKATLQPSLGKELMGLYLFIGVEPTHSLEDDADLAEISNSLQFLKSVVGVK